MQQRAASGVTEERRCHVQQELRCNSEWHHPFPAHTLLLRHMNCSDYSHYIRWQDLIANVLT